MSKYLESLLQDANPSTITEIFFWLILLSLFIAIVLRKEGKANAFVHYSATLLTSLGILGTFIGIVVGLLDFDPNKIDESIGYLLAGLKTAFITSLVGMSASIIFKLLGSISWFIKSEETGLQGVGAEDIYRAINEQGKSILESSQAQQSLLAELKQAIVGSEDDTLVSQIKLLRGDMNDNHKMSFKAIQVIEDSLKTIQNSRTEQQALFQHFSDKLWLKLQDVADMISKSATEQVINALKEVIVDFNNNLIEQFGDNFKALDESVKKLVLWQENYSKQIEQMVEQYALGVTAINQTKDSVSIISEKSAHIPETMNNLKLVMEVNQHQIEELERHLDTFKDMRDRAVEAVPEIRKQVEETVNEIALSVQKTNDHYAALLTESDKYIQQYVEKSNEMLDKFVSNTKEGIEAVKTGLVEGTEVIGADLRKSSEEVQKAISEGAENFVKATLGSNDSLAATANELEKQAGVISKQLDDTVAELNNHTREMVNTIVDGSKNLSSTLQETNQKTLTNIDQVQSIVTDNIERMQKRFEGILEEIFQSQANEVRKVFDALEREVKIVVESTGEAVDKQVKLIEDASSKEVNTIMNEMGRALTSITKQFTKDYSQLVNAMSAIVNNQGRK